MIKIETNKSGKTKGEFEGTESELLAELSTIIEELKKKGIPERAIKISVELGLADDQATFMANKIGELLTEGLEKLKKALEEIEEEIEEEE